MVLLRCFHGRVYRARGCLRGYFCGLWIVVKRASQGLGTLGPATRQCCPALLPDEMFLWQRGQSHCN